MLISVVCLILCLLVLALGPILNPYLLPRKKLMAFLDGFVLTSVLALLALHILPHAMESSGLWVLLVALLAFILPGLIEKWGAKYANASHQTTLFVALIGLLFHMFADGIALVQPESLHNPNATFILSDIVPITIFLHSIPMALMVWWIIRPFASFKISVLILACLGLSLVTGFGFGLYVAAGDHHDSFGLFEGLVVGSLLHVMFHQTAHQKIHTGWQWPQGLGSLCALFIGFILNQFVPLLSHSHYWQNTCEAFVRLALLSAPSLLLAYLAAGLIQAFLPKAKVQWLTQGTPFTQSLKGMLFGLPLPVCSCGVVPLYKSLVQRGTPLASGLAFFVATPELGLDAILISLPLLGSQMMLLRLFAAAFVALMVGWIMGTLFKKHPSHLTSELETTPQASFLEKLTLSLKSAFGEILDHTGPWIMVGLSLAAILDPVLSQTTLAQVPSLAQVPLMALLGMPIYVCASGATPLVAVLLAKGLSHGAALAFLLTGPATNVTTFGILSYLHGKKVAFVFSILMFILPVGLGYAVDFWFADLALPPLPTLHEHSSLGLQEICLFILTVAFALLLLRKGPRHLMGQIVSFEEEEHKHHPIDSKVLEAKKTSSCCP